MGFSTVKRECRRDRPKGKQMRQMFIRNKSMATEIQTTAKTKTDNEVANIRGRVSHSVNTQGQKVNK